MSLKPLIASTPRDHMLNIAKNLIASPEWRVFVALSIGLMMGIERERRKGEGRKRAAAGMRTFAFVSLLGGISAQTDSAALIVVAGTFTAGAALLSHWLGDRSDPGLTTEVALLVAFLLGVLAQSQTFLALATGVVVTALLEMRNPLHRFVREMLSESELRDGLIFSIAALVVLPFLPDRTVDPFGLVNPFAIWRLIVVLLGLSATGYCALRIWGARYGLVIAGFASGFISSTAAIAAMGNRARGDDRLNAPGAAGAIASVLGSLVYLLGLIAVTDVDMLRLLVWPCGLALAATLAYALVLAAHGSAAELSPKTRGRAFDLLTVAIFASLVVIFALVSAAILAWLGEAAVLVSAAASGLIDVHASSVSIATLVASGKIDRMAGTVAVLAALTTNMASKIPAAFAVGPRGYAVRVAAGLAILLVGLWGGFFWMMISVGT